jgi:hypothetical protein
MRLVIGRTHKAAVARSQYVTRCGVRFYFYRSTNDWRRVTCKRCLNMAYSI